MAKITSIDQNLVIYMPVPNYNRIWEMYLFMYLGEREIGFC